MREILEPGARLALLAALALLASACATTGPPAGPPGRELLVTATAYNSLPGQTDAQPDLAAWGDRLRPGMRAVAVSPDLIALGLERGTRLRIEGLHGEYTVLDKTAARWGRRIDIYMGTDRRAAQAWGKRRVRITWGTAPPPERSGFWCTVFGRCG